VTDAWNLIQGLAGAALRKGEATDPDVRALLTAFAKRMDPEAPQTAELLTAAEAVGDLELLAALRVLPPTGPAEWPIGATVKDPIWGPDVPLVPLHFLVEDHRTHGHRAGMIELGTAGYLIGAGGVGKGFVALDLAVAVAAGTPNSAPDACPRWMGADGFPVTNPGHVLFLTAEDRQRHIQRRLRALMLARGLKGPVLARAQTRLHVVCTQDTPGMRGLRLQDTDGTRSAECESLLLRLRATAEQRLEEQGGDPEGTDGGVPWRLIVIDTLSRTASPEAETNQDHAGRFTELLEELTDCNPAGTDPAVAIAIHHTGKGKARSEGAHQSRGASALTDNARWVGVLNPATKADDDGPLSPWRTFDVAKVNHGPPIRVARLEQRQGSETGGVLDMRTQEDFARVRDTDGNGTKSNTRKRGKEGRTAGDGY
jgi:hypothetical protein